MKSHWVLKSSRCLLACVCVCVCVCVWWLNQDSYSWTRLSTVRVLFMEISHLFPGGHFQLLCVQWRYLYPFMKIFLSFCLRKRKWKVTDKFFLQKHSGYLSCWTSSLYIQNQLAPVYYKRCDFSLCFLSYSTLCVTAVVIPTKHWHLIIAKSFTSDCDFIGYIATSCDGESKCISERHCSHLSRTLQ